MTWPVSFRILYDLCSLENEVLNYDIVCFI